VVSYTDPWVPNIREGHHRLQSVDVDSAIAAGFDCAVITTDHSAFDYPRLAKLPLIVDTRNALKGMTGANIVRL